MMYADTILKIKLAKLPGIFLNICSNSFKIISAFRINDSLIAAIQCFIAHCRTVITVQGGLIMTRFSQDSPYNECISLVTICKGICFLHTGIKHSV